MSNRFLDVLNFTLNSAKCLITVDPVLPHSTAILHYIKLATIPWFSSHSSFRSNYSKTNKKKQDLWIQINSSV